MTTNRWHKNLPNWTDWRGTRNVRVISPKPKKQKISEEDPKLIELFKQHCEAGWSPRSFIGLLQGGCGAYERLRVYNREFYELNKIFTQARNRKPKIVAEFE